MKKLFSKVWSLLLVATLMFTIFGGIPAAAQNPTPSTNDINRTLGWAHVDQIAQGVGTTTLRFISTRNFLSCFEYRTDGDTSQMINPNNYNPLILDGLYPFTCRNNNTLDIPFTANDYVEVRMVFGAESDERFDWTRFDVLAKPELSATTADALFCTGETTDVYINLADVIDMYGYQFEVSYDATYASAIGAFENGFFDTTTNAVIPGPAWNANCTTTPGVCKFAVSKQYPGTAVTGSGNLAKITLTGVAPGTFNMAISNDILSDIDGIALVHDLGASLPITVCGWADISGFITMQGRPGNNVDAGTVEVVELDSPDNFGPFSASAAFSNSNGAYTLASIPFMPGGSNYKITAKHDLYLDNTKDILVTGNLTGQDTRLWGGDANNDGKVSIADLSCIGGDFGGPPGTCAGLGSPDINADGFVNIQDLSIAGGNHDKCSPQPWAWNVDPPNYTCP